VYRATDTNLKRQVAIKVLPASVAGDADRLARFQREAEVLAALNHPNIAAIHGLERTPDFTALVMELVEGDDLSQRIARGAIPVDEALPIAKQIAEALEAAHEQGIVHRDLKPANIKVRADGTVRVLDFGLAKALDPAAASSPEAMNSPTITSPAMTQAGMILGTAAYMAPEQAKGHTVDRRADVWAFGVVLFEMLTGRRAFAGEGIADTLGNVMKVEPDWSRLPATLSPTLATFIRRCLNKNPKQRPGDMQSVRLALEGAFETAAPQATATTASASRERRPLIAALAVAVLGLVALAIPAVRHLRETPTPAPPEMRLEIATPATSDVMSFAVSPDGRQIVFVASGDGGSRLWVRPLDTTAVQPLAGTEGATYPFWSPDSRSIGFFADSKLKRLDLSGGAPQTLAPVSAGRGGTWSADGVILFAANTAGPLLRVPAGGGDVVPVTTLGADQRSHQFPQFLPGGRQFLFYAQGSTETAGIYLGALDAAPVTRVTAADTAGAYLPTGPGSTDAFREGGWLLFGRQGTLVARRFDAARGALSGDPVTVADALAIDASLTLPCHLRRA
jgi:serine/threonine protein kinase